MPVFVRVGGVWKDFVPKVKVSGVWRTIQYTYARVGGVWKQLYDSAFIDTQSLITGVSGTAPSRLRGFLSGTMGAVLDGYSNIYAARPQIAQLLHNEATGQIVFSVFGTHANSGWTSMVIGGNVYFRTGGSFAQGGGQSYWIWNGPYFGDNVIATFA
jgi:hypothetical protein